MSRIPTHYIGLHRRQVVSCHFDRLTSKITTVILIKSAASQRSSLILTQPQICQAADTLIALHTGAQQSSICTK